MTQTAALQTIAAADLKAGDRVIAFRDTRDPSYLNLDADSFVDGGEFVEQVEAEVEDVEVRTWREFTTLVVVLVGQRSAFAMSADLLVVAA